MNFSFIKALEILENTPKVVFTMLNNLSAEWTSHHEGENTWTSQEVIAHLIICEETNWLVRAKIIWRGQTDEVFKPMDMTAHFELAKNNSLPDLLNTFSQLRAQSLQELKTWQLQEADFAKIGIHPTLGEVNLQELISTWVTHDLSHISQIARIIAKQNKELVGKFYSFLKILH